MSMNPSKRFSGIYLLSCFGLLALAVSVNVVGNSTNLFPSSLFPPLTDRAWKTRRLDEAVRDRRPPEVIILGSSRVMQIQPKYVEAVTGKRAFNYGVAVATPIDYLTQLRYLLSIGCRPKMILLGVDEFAFRFGYGRGGAQTLGHLGLFQEMPYPENRDAIATAFESIDLGTTQDSLLRFMRKRKRNLEDAGDVLLDDGYLIFVNFVRKKEEGTFDLAANIAADVKHEDLTGDLQDALLRQNPRKLAVFKEFLSLAQAEGIEVRVMFLPLHPDFERQRLTERLAKARLAMTQNLQTICSRYGVLYRDFTNLGSYDGDPNEFYDAVHQSPVNSRRMINALFSIKASDVVADLPGDSYILKHLPPVTTLTTE